MASRERFEAFAQGEPLGYRNFTRDRDAVDEPYTVLDVQLCWLAWQAAAADTAERCAVACDGEYVDADATGEEADRAYNRACDDCAAACRAVGEDCS